MPKLCRPPWLVEEENFWIWMACIGLKLKRWSLWTYVKCDSTNFPKYWCRWSCKDTKSLPTSTKSMTSVKPLCMFRTPNTLKRLFVVVDLNHVFNRLAVENDRSGVQDVVGLIISNLKLWWHSVWDFFQHVQFPWLFYTYFTLQFQINVHVRLFFYLKN